MNSAPARASLGNSGLDSQVVEILLMKHASKVAVVRNKLDVIVADMKSRRTGSFLCSNKLLPFSIYTMLYVIIRILPTLNCLPTASFDESLMVTNRTTRGNRVRQRKNTTQDTCGTIPPQPNHLSAPDNCDWCVCVCGDPERDREAVSGHPTPIRLTIKSRSLPP